MFWDTGASILPATRSALAVARRPLAPATGVVEARPVEARTGQLGPVGAAAGGVDGVEPLGEEVAETRPARVAVLGQEALELRLQLSLRDAGAAVVPLDPLEGPVEPL